MDKIYTEMISVPTGPNEPLSIPEILALGKLLREIGYSDKGVTQIEEHELNLMAQASDPIEIRQRK